MTPPVAGLFVSGHSLTDRRMLQTLAAIMQDAGQPLAWNMQNIPGSSLMKRTMGSDATSPWSGFTTGVDRSGAQIDVLAELRAPSAGGAAYDALLLTELHSVLDSLTEHDTARYLAEYRRRFLDINPQGGVWFMAPWLSLSSLEDPRDWIAYERNALPVWRCAVSTATGSPAPSEARTETGFIPASLALAELVNHLVEAPRPGFERPSHGDIVRDLFADQVHLTELGETYIALIIASAIYGVDPASLALPATVDPDKARTLTAFASRFVENYRATEDSEKCPAGISLAFAWQYAGYAGEIFHADKSWPERKIRQVRNTLRYRWNLGSVFSAQPVDG